MFAEIWNRLARPRLIFRDHSSSLGCALISLMLPSCGLKPTFTGRDSFFCIASEIFSSAGLSCSLESRKFPVT